MTVKNDFETEVKHNYKVFLAGKERTFSSVILTKSPFGDKMSFTVAEIERLSYLASLEICMDNSSLSVVELEFMRKLFDITQVQVADALRMSPGIISKWKKTHESDIGFSESILLKNFFKDKLKRAASKKISPLEHGLIVQKVLSEMFASLNQDLDDKICSEVVRIAYEKVVTRNSFIVTRQTYKPKKYKPLDEVFGYEKVLEADMKYEEVPHMDIEELKHAIGC